VQLTADAQGMLQEYKLAYRGARESLKTSGMPTEEEMAALARVSERFGEPVELIAHPFNLINKMTLLIADPELDERATFYAVPAGQADLAQSVCDQFNKLGKIEARALAGPWTQPDALAGVKTIRDGDNEVKLVKIKVMARLHKGRIVIDTMDTNLQGEFEKIADKAGLDMDCSVPPKLAALLENVKKEEANPRSASGRVKQIIFCDILPLHNKIRRLLVKHAGIAAAAIIVVSGQTIKNAEQMQGVQDGFNAEGEENRYRTVIANEKAEVGINLQKGTQAIHHLTIGWTPDSTIQRNGRGVRQGNSTRTVNVYHYDADGTFDEYKRTLTSKKADWIGAVMDKQGGNDVAIAGGLTAQEYDNLINAVGDESAMQAIRDRAEAKDRAARAETARARQVINFKTVKAQQEFVEQYPDGKAWLIAKAMQLYDLKQAIITMDLRVRNKVGSAKALITMETRLAEARARAEGLTKLLNECGTYKVHRTVRVGGYGSSFTTEEVETDVDEVLRDAGGYKSAAKIRESIESGMKWKAEVKPGSELHQEWESEMAAAQGMVDEALKDFDRLAKEQPGTYPAQMVEAIKAGDTASIDGKLFAKGMFVRDPSGVLAIISGTDRITAMRADGKTAGSALVDAVGKGWSFIMFGTPEYEAAVQEAARIDDSVQTVNKDTRSSLFSSISADVAKARKGETMVRYAAERSKLPAPYFPYAIDPSTPGLSPALEQVVAKQAEVIKRWERAQYGYVYIHAASTWDVVEDHSQDDQNKKTQALVAYARGHGVKLSFGDMKAVMNNYSSSSMWRVTELGTWPKVQGYGFFDAAQDVEALDAMARRVVDESLDFMDPAALAEVDFDDIAPIPLKVSYNIRRKAFSDEKLRAQRVADIAAGALPDVAPIEPQAPASPSLPPGVVPNGLGLIGITGETRPNKEKIKAAAKMVGGYAKWNGDKVQWDVPAATWPYIVQNDPELAKVLQVVLA
jgi:hypothetical protein